MSDVPTTGRPYDDQKAATPSGSSGSGTPYGAALLAGAGVFGLYALTLAPTTAFWDTSEYIATAHILGIPHPPGNPLFVIMARAWELILAPTGLSVAVRVNLFSVLMTAGASVFWFLMVHRILSYFTGNETVRKVGAAAGVLLSATAFTVWNQSNVNEKVYTVSLFTIALLSWLAFVWREHAEKHRGMAVNRKWHDDNIILLAIYVLALSVGNHLMAFLAAPALGVMLLMVNPRVLTNWRLYVGAIIFGILGLSVHLYLPLRAALDPIINEAAPTCQSLSEALVSVVTLGASGCEDLSAALAREQYAKPPVTQRQAPLLAQIINYLQYFDWQWSRSLMGRQGWFAPARIPFTALFMGLGVFGAWMHAKRDRISFAYFATLFATLSLGLVFYLNFKYGYGQVSAWGRPFSDGEVRERDYFFIVSFSMWGLWAGVGLTALWLRIAEKKKLVGKAVLRASPVMGIALLPLVLNWQYASRAGDYSARDWAWNLLNSVEPYGVLFTNGDNDTFPLWYLQEVEGVRRDVTVMVWSYLNTPWYVKQVRELSTPCEEAGAASADRTRIICQREFDPSTAASIYTEASYPTRPILPLSDEDIDEVTRIGYVQIPQGGAVFESRGLQVPLPEGTALVAADQFILNIIQNAWGDRPIYFAMTTNAHRNLGLAPNVVRQGLAFRLVNEEDIAAGDYTPMPQDPTWHDILGAYVDGPRTRQLLWDEFIYRGMPETMSHWPDDATRGIPGYYGYAHIALLQVEQAEGNTEEIQKNTERSDAWLMLSDR